MKQDNRKTIVIFRVFKDGGGGLALFPNEPGTIEAGSCSSYQRIGQHSGADYAHCMKITRAATIEEYAALKNELENHCGYHLIVRQRARVKMWRMNETGSLVEA